MNPKTFFLICGAVFLIVAAAHLTRLVYGWEILIAGWAIRRRHPDANRKSLDTPRSFRVAVAKHSSRPVFCFHGEAAVEKRTDRETGPAKLISKYMAGGVMQITFPGHAKEA